MYQGESFQEIIQRYNRELMKLQRKTARSEELPPMPAGSSGMEEDGIEIEGTTNMFMEPQPEVTGLEPQDDDFVNYLPGPLPLPGGNPVPRPCPGDLTGENCSPTGTLPPGVTTPPAVTPPTGMLPPPIKPPACILPPIGTVPPMVPPGTGTPGKPGCSGSGSMPPSMPPSMPSPMPPSMPSPMPPSTTPAKPVMPPNFRPGGNMVWPPDTSRCEDRNVLHSQTVGSNGPVLLQDSILHETLETFIHGTQLMRPLHIKGWGASGSFRCMHSMKAYTSAAFLQETGTTVSVRVRFSQASGNAGTPDTMRNIRGFATKFYTKDGNFDIVGNNIPVFFLRDAIRFPEVVAALSPSPITNLAEPERLWNFIARTPEAVNMVTWLYSDVGLVRSYRKMRGFGINTFVWKNAEGKRKYVKYHWLPMAGEEYLTREEAEALMADPDALGRDLYTAIAKGEPVEYELNVQLMDPEDAGKLSYDPLDDTKVWDEKKYPLMPVGRMKLDKNPEHYANQVEKLAFSPANLVKGIELSDDKMLQGRSFLYWDSQRRRLGENFRNIPVNETPGGWSPEKLVTSGEGVRACGDQLRTEIHNPDNFTQAGERYRSMNPQQKERLVDNIAVELYQLGGMTQSCVVGYLYQADPELGARTQRMIEAYLKRR